MTLENWWKQAKRRGVVYYVTERVSRSGMGASYTLYVVDRDGTLERAWPSSPCPGGHTYDAKLASALGFRLGKNLRAWYRGGCGYDRVHDVLDSIARHFDGKSFNQTKVRWEGLNID